MNTSALAYGPLNDKGLPDWGGLCLPGSRIGLAANQLTQ
jgi:hypothetical protein